jgi:phospholipid-binding lipoprotein MlaA
MTFTHAASRAKRLLLGALLLLALTGCAVGPDKRDPFENFNRGVMRFNDEVDSAILKPVATAYQENLPSPARKAVGNVFSNLGDVWSTVNSLLQLKFPQAVEGMMRVSFNTVFGLYGILDVATEMGLERHSEDFGQTLGRWGVPSGPYVVLPLFGPSTVRDAGAFVVDRRADLVREFDPASTRNSLYALRIVDHRASLLRSGQLLDQISLDRYTFVRDVYLQRRQAEIFEPETSEPAQDKKEE